MSPCWCISSCLACRSTGRMCSPSSPLSTSSVTTTSTRPHGRSTHNTQGGGEGRGRGEEGGREGGEERRKGGVHKSDQRNRTRDHICSTPYYIYIHTSLGHLCSILNLYKVWPYLGCLGSGRWMPCAAR
jgi:hypothetical protein